MKREDELRESLSKLGAPFLERLTLYKADLNEDHGWNAAASGCDYVLHVASPFPLEAPKNEDELIVPAREGTLRVLKAARDAKVKRVVVTSSFAAVGYGHENKVDFDERDWTDLSKPLAAYLKSKTIAERAAWDFVAREGQGLELSVVNPVGIFGPVPSRDLSASVSLVKMMIEGSMPVVPKLHFGIVDARDVADLELRAMTHPSAAGERFLAVNDGGFSLPEMAKTIRDHFGARASKVPKYTLPDWLVRIGAFFSPKMKALTPQLGHISNISNRKAKEILGWSPRSNQETVIASAKSIIESETLKN